MTSTLGHLRHESTQAVLSFRASQDPKLVFEIAVGGFRQLAWHFVTFRRPSAPEACRLTDLCDVETLGSPML